MPIMRVIVDINLDNPVMCWEGIKRMLRGVKCVKKLDCMYISELFDQGFIEFNVEVDTKDYISEVEDILNTSFFVRKMKVMKNE